MSQMSWQGVMPAVTTPLAEDGSVDHAFLSRHVSWLIEHGATGIVPCGSLGEGATLTFEEKLAVIKTCVAAAGDAAPVMPGIASLATGEAVRLARGARDAGCRALMVLPPYVHKGTWDEIRHHFSAVLDATELPCMLYNNPIAYGTDVRAPEIGELADAHENLEAVKESSGDSRRITAIRAHLGERLALFVGLDDMVLEGVQAGAVGWVAGLVNALPRESGELFRLARAGRTDEAFALYRWFLPLLRLDTVPEFVQLIKLVQQEVGMGHERVRPPRRALADAERERVLTQIRDCLASNPMGRS